MKLPKPVWDYLQKQAWDSMDDCQDATLALCRQVAPAAALLDCGCADGTFTARVAEAVKANQVLGVDVVPENIAAARVRNVQGVLCDLDSGLPFADGSIDLVVASHVIEHVADTDTLVRECYRVLKAGGHLVMATPNLAAFTNILFLILGRQPTIVEVSDVALVGTWSPRGTCIARTGPAHRRIFTARALRGLLQYYGFTCDKTVASGFLPLPGLLGRLASTLLPRYAFNILVRARKPA